MNDRELLELAAKAAGLKYTKPTDDYDGALGLAAGENPMRTRTWNPLTDDGDALRLAVKLGFSILTYSNNPNREVTAVQVNAGPICKVNIGRDEVNPRGCINTATRRAIVRAAAEIGKAMP